METVYFKEFIELARIGNYQQAANNLFIAQSSLSKHIKKMEKELGQLLFERSTRKVELTDFGRAFLPYAIEMNHCMQRYTSELIESWSHQNKNVSVGFVPTILIDKMSTLVHDFKKENPNCTISVVQGDYDRIKSSMDADEFTVTIIPEIDGTVDDDFITVKSSHKNKIVAVVHKDHPLAGKKKINIESLKDEIFIQLSGASLVFNASNMIFEKASYKPKYDFTVQKSDVIIKMIENKMGISLLLETLAHDNYSPNVSIVDIDPTVKIHTVLKYPKNRKLTTEEEWLINYWKSKSL